MRPIVVWKDYASMPSIFLQQIGKIIKPKGSGDLMFAYLVPDCMAMSDAAIAMEGIRGEKVNCGVEPGIITFVFSDYTGEVGNEGSQLAAGVSDSNLAHHSRPSLGDS